LTSPRRSPRIAALPEAANLALPTATSIPARRASASVMPTEASSGSVKAISGTRWSNAEGRPAITSAATLPSSIALCASAGPGVRSPIARIDRTAVRRRSSTSR
jgi:hypothetical protein